MTKKKSVASMVNPAGQSASPGRIINHIALVVDESGSMNHLTTKVREEIDRQIKNIQRNTLDSDQDTFVSIYTFADDVRQIAREVPAANVGMVSYRPGGQTSLHDGVNKAIQDLSYHDRRKLGSHSFLVIVITDGQENNSRGPECGTEIRRLSGLDNWSFAFLMPPGQKRQALALGVPEGNVVEWEATYAGLERASVQTMAATSGYYAARSRGELKTQSFFTNLAGVAQRDLNKLDDVTGEFKQWKVERECPIAALVESKGHTYQIGRGFYELTKREEVQGHKDIVIMDRTSKTLYGGDKARDLIGIAKGPGVVVKVSPGNHANYRIFVSSTSVNRKLVRGTTLLYRTA